MRIRSACRCLLLILVFLSSIESSRAEAPPNTHQDLELGTLELAAGRVGEAIASFRRAVALDPTSAAATLDLAIACLAGSELDEARRLAESLSSDSDLKVSRDYLLACVHLRRQEWSQATTVLEAVRRQRPDVAAVHFQLGWAAEATDDAMAAAAHYREAARLAPGHGAASYRSSRALAATGRPEEAALALAAHRRILASRILDGQPRAVGPDLPARASYEACELLEPVIPFSLRMPARAGPQVRFAISQDSLDRGAEFGAPLCAVDAGMDGMLDVVAGVEGGGLVLLGMSDTRLVRRAELAAGGSYEQVLAGDLDNDGTEDLVAIAPRGCRVWRMDRDGNPSDATVSAQLAEVQASAGLLVDLDHSGSLDLLLHHSAHEGVPGRLRFMRNRGAAVLVDESHQLTSIGDFMIDASIGPLVLAELNGDDLVEVLIPRGTAGTLRLAARRKRAPEIALAPLPWPHATLLAADDLDGDFATDVVVLTGTQLEVRRGTAAPAPIANDVTGAVQLQLLDYDNDGWLDLLVTGQQLRLWRNLGGGSFVEVSDDCGLAAIPRVEYRQVLPMDFDGDGDLDLLAARVSGGLVLLRNEGGSANSSLSIRLKGTRSNGSGIGARIELHGEHLRTSRMVSKLPIHLGLGELERASVLNVVWLDQTFQLVDVEPAAGATLEIVEPYVETGSCPYLYAWNGERFRFVTDILGAAPLGLRLTEEVLVSADPDELVWIGGEEDLAPLDGHYELRVTEELREILYLDHVELIIVDHPAEVEVHATDKLRPPPFPPSTLVPLHQRRELLAARSTADEDSREALESIDGVRVGPTRLRGAQLRGLAEPWDITLDFGELDGDRDWILALTGWLRYGGATGNVAGALHPEVSPPTPRLLAEDRSGVWCELPVVVGLPAGKTKTILVELGHELPENCQRLRLTSGFEVYWDRIALFERYTGADVTITHRGAAAAELRWHGHGAVEAAAPNDPLTTSYERLRPVPPWRWTPAGRTTRYGDVDDLLNSSDNRLVILGAGDEVALSFDSTGVPPTPASVRRDFFFYSVGWDKDADVHCVRGLSVLPLPFHGMDDQLYGTQQRPDDLPSAWIEEYCTRIVDSVVPGSRLDARTFPSAKQR